MEADFKKEFIDKYSIEEFTEVEGLIDFALECQTGAYKKGKLWRINCDIEKIHCLQFNYYISLSKEGVDGSDEEVSLGYENGINAGTSLREYSFDRTVLPASRTIEILEDIVLDEKTVLRKYPKVKIQLARLMFEGVKDQILDILRKQGYDNYVTGGGTNVTDKYYKDKLQKFQDRGLFWTKVYKQEEADLNLV